jgi:pentatricopeptide repeat protein
MFVKCDSIQDAERVFDKMEVRDVISWTAMIQGYAEHGPFGKAKEVFRQMQCNGIEPDLVTFICLIKACANQASLQEARWVHSIIEVAGFGSDLRVATSMVHMYAKCGSVIDARSIFNKMDEQDLATWNAMIVGLAQHGYGREALQHFHHMILEGLCPNGLTYLGVLSACGHAGFVDEGLGYFFSMSKDYAISPTVEHFGCMVDLLGRAGELDEAEDFVNKMPQTPGAAVWGSLLGACRLHGNVRLAEVVARFLLGFDPQNAAVYVSLAHIYATANLWDKATSLKKLMEERGIKEAGLS